MKKRDFVLLFLVLLFAFLFVANNRDLFKKSSPDEESVLIQETSPLFVPALIKGKKNDLERIYKNFNKLNYPVALFNLTMDPVVWNDAALNYRGDYAIVKTVEILGNPIGYVGVGAKNQTEKKSSILNLWIFLLILFFIVSFFSFNLFKVLYLIFLLALSLITKELFPVFLFFSMLYIAYGKRYINDKLASLVFLFLQ
ncbi:hypothetical protein TTHT_1721 [Thermotomaculum hydrothermale]|uniref:Uncharacterized protein n=1 Tax=Thermotomaculum hydrothermale TaxID=981385 RepID=A0A7R6Q0D4_9BACT|nr:hypothetical protein [Thermotomaculum hydrothermale]BBB33193.1 hypothetical protein TTHT_1721 [Thermotomaculum hydrothermale]